VEEWLSVQECFRFPLSGLQGEELWQFCDTVVSDLELTLKRDEHFSALLDRLEGNPLAVRAILLRLKDRSAAELLTELEENFNGLEGDESTKRILAALAVFERGLDKAFAPVLRLLGLHEHFACAYDVEDMLKHTEPDGMAYVEKCFAALESAGLCHLIRERIYKLHPALRSCLTRLHPADVSDKRAFVDFMGNFANTYGGKELHEQWIVFSLFKANFYRALSLARELDTRDCVFVLLQALASYACNVRNFVEAKDLYKKFAETTQNYFITKYEGVAYHQLGTIALEQQDLNTADGMFQKALKIEKELDDKQGMAITYHSLGVIAEVQWDLDTAEKWCNLSLAIKQELGDEYGMALTYHELGMLVEKRGDLDVAEDWYNQALIINQKLDDEHGMAINYHELGIVAKERGELNTAREWYKKSLIILERLNDQYSANIVRGSIARLQT